MKQLRPFTCTFCEATLHSFDMLKRHRKRHMVKYTRACAKRKLHGNHRQISDLRTQSTCIGLLFQCKICKQYFVNKSNLVEHLKTHSNPNNASKDRLLIYNDHPSKPDKKLGHNKRLQYCSQYSVETFDFDIQTRNEEQQYHHSLNITQGSSPKTCIIIGKDKPFEYDNTKEKPYMCLHCQKRFAYRKNLSKHMRTHSKDKPYKCEHCEKGFTRNDNLKIHMRIHTKEKPYQCKYCQKCFAQKGNLDGHIRTHTNEKPYQCQYCQKGYITGGTLKVHMRTHTGEKPYQCEHCQKCFARCQDWKRHLGTHRTKKQENPYQCKYCQKCFPEEGNLNYHIRTHTKNLFNASIVRRAIQLAGLSNCI
ncbi:uncharacterized protein [Amphiura filiformis]|uniref:uncharacterized protein n=1 Tax=Amphiura filiformis TaxID=82378 RepID=UPI003B226C17